MCWFAHGPTTVSAYRAASTACYAQQPTPVTAAAHTAGASHTPSHNAVIQQSRQGLRAVASPQIRVPRQRAALACALGRIQDARSEGSRMRVGKDPGCAFGRIQDARSEGCRMGLSWAQGPPLNESSQVDPGQTIQ